VRTTAIPDTPLAAPASSPALEQVAAGSVVAFRIAFGLCAALVAARFVARGWVGRLYLDPTYHFTYPSLGWVRPLAPWAMYGGYGLMVMAGLALAVGWHHRWAAAVFTVCFAYAEAIDVTTYLNHYELVTLMGVLCCVLPIPGRRGRRGRQTVDRWVVWVLRFQLAVVYVFAGIGKVDVQWLLHGEPLHTWLRGRSDLPLVGGWLGEPGLAVALSIAGAVFDLSIVGFLLWRRSRPWAYVAVIGFHLITGWLFPGIGAFPLVMIALTPIFFAPDWPQRVGARLGRVAVVRPDPVRDGRIERRPTKLVAVGVGLWVLVQLVVPLRHLAYPGDVRWTEEGYRWSWRVLLTEKEGLATFTLRDPADGATQRIYPGDELAPHQVRYMATRPDLIRQYARHLADEAEAEGWARPRVTAEVWVTMNGWPRQLLIDPEADLAAEGTGLGASPSILPSPGEGDG